MSEILTNLSNIQKQMNDACKKAGRDSKEVLLVAVSKTKPLSQILEAAQAGQKDFGENYVQEAVEKVEQASHLRWHFIGRLQTNKVKQVVGKFTLIHSVDRIKLAKEISDQAIKLGLQQDVLLQIHVGDEATKAGFSISEVPKVIQELIALKGLRICGLMALPPLSNEETETRGWFRELREAQRRWRSDFFHNNDSFVHLSMGTTHDFEIAIEEGATMIRIGTAIFGERVLP